MNTRIPLERSGLLPDGTYKMMIKKAEMKQGKEHQYIALELIAFGSNGKPTDDVIYDNVSLAPKSRWVLRSLLDAIDAPKDGTMDVRELRGKVFYATLGNETYQGRIKNTVAAFITPEMAGVSYSELSNSGDYFPDEDETPSPKKGFEWSDEDVTDDEESSVVDQMPDELAGAPDVAF
jgi:hypothetical protein